MDSVVWVHHHQQMLSPDGKTKFEIFIKNKKCLFMTVTYKVFKSSMNCHVYPKEAGYDHCTIRDTENHLMQVFGCVLPISNSSHQICMNNTASIKAFSLHDNTIGKFSPTCPHPCHTMQVVFGFPSYGECGKQPGTAYARLYFKQSIEVIQDRLNYSLLRYCKYNLLNKTFQNLTQIYINTRLRSSEDVV